MCDEGITVSMLYFEKLLGMMNVMGISHLRIITSVL